MGLNARAVLAAVLLLTLGARAFLAWKLPLFGETDVNRVLAEADACHKANPNNHVRLVGYDKLKQTQGAAMVVFRGKTV